MAVTFSLTFCVCIYSFFIQLIVYQYFVIVLYLFWWRVEPTLFDFRDGISKFSNFYWHEIIVKSEFWITGLIFCCCRTAPWALLEKIWNLPFLMMKKLHNMYPSSTICYNNNEYNGDLIYAHYHLKSEFYKNPVGI